VRVPHSCSLITLLWGSQTSNSAFTRASASRTARSAVLPQSRTAPNSRRKSDSVLVTSANSACDKLGRARVHACHKPARATRAPLCRRLYFFFSNLHPPQPCRPSPTTAPESAYRVRVWPSRKEPPRRAHPSSPPSPTIAAGSSRSPPTPRFSSKLFNTTAPRVHINSTPLSLCPTTSTFSSPQLKRRSRRS
jgi:hypothetical protein